MRSFLVHSDRARIMVDAHAEERRAHLRKRQDLASDQWKNQLEVLAWAGLVASVVALVLT